MKSKNLVRFLFLYILVFLRVPGAYAAIEEAVLRANGYQGVSALCISELEKVLQAEYRGDDNTSIDEGLVRVLKRENINIEILDALAQNGVSEIPRAKPIEWDLINPFSIYQFRSYSPLNIKERTVGDGRPGQISFVLIEFFRFTGKTVLRGKLQKIVETFPFLRYSVIQYTHPLLPPPSEDYHGLVGVRPIQSIGKALSKARTHIAPGGARQDVFDSYLLFTDSGEEIIQPPREGKVVRVTFERYSDKFETAVRWQEFSEGRKARELFVNGYAVRFRDLKGNVYVDFMGNRAGETLVTPMDKLGHLEMNKGYEVSIVGWDRYPHLFWPDKKDYDPYS